MRPAASILLLGMLSSASTGCGFHPYLYWRSGAPAATVEGRVAVKYVPNQRPPQHGAGEFQTLGNQRSGFGIPYPVRLTPPNPTIDQTLVQLVSGALATAGIGTTSAMDPAATAHMAIEVNDFWCDGYFLTYEATVNLQLVLIDPQSGMVRTRVPIQHKARNDQCRSAYRDALNRVHLDVVAAFAQPGVRIAAVSPGVAAPPAVPASPTEPPPAPTTTPPPSP